MMFRALAAAALTVAAVPALAADLPTRKSAPIMAVVAPMYNWTGFYVGAQAGWMGGGDDSVGMRAFNRNVGYSYNNLGDVAPRGGFGGLRAGYDWQALGSPFVIGAVGDINFSDSKHTARRYISPTDLVSTRSKVEWDGSLRLRAGYAWDRFLVYATGGVAFAQNKYRQDVTNSTLGLIAHSSKSDTMVGGTIGAGLQYAITNNLVAGVEYRYTGFDSKNVRGSIYPVAGGGWIETKATPNFHRIAATLDWKF